MADVVTFDPVRRRIIEIDTGGDNVIDVVEIYSEWKDWLLADASRLGHPQAFSVVGGDPISDIQNLGSTFFLENRWRFQPSERNHRVELVGNLYTREPGEDISVDTLGLYRVTVVQRVSNLVDASVARLDLDQLLQSVYIDTARGVAGTAEGVGTPTNPVNNIADAYAIAVAKNLRSYSIRGSLTLDQDYNHWTFVGLSAHVDLTHVLNLNGYDVDQCVFDELNMIGTMTGRIMCNRCGLGVVSGLDGAFTSCGLFSDITLDDDCFCALINCFSMLPGSSRPAAFFGSNSQAQFRNWDGGLELRTLTDGCVVSVDLDTGRCGINTDCTGGDVTLRGHGDKIDNSEGRVNVEDSGFVSVDAIATEVHARGRLARRLNLAVEADSVLREIE